MHMVTMLNSIERDLRAFADPGSVVLVDRDTAVWVQHGQEMTVRFSAAAPGAYPDVTVDDVKMPYRAFLASHYVADLTRLADFIVKTLVPAKASIETSAKLEDPDANVPPGLYPATQLVRARATQNLPFLSTRVSLVKGEAGSGKTIALRALTRSQAQLYLDGKIGTLFFYVDVQGRALARLEDAMAKDLQDLRSQFSYAAIGPLTRHGLLVPIIDGFDELLGSGGYDDAFSSLAAFLAQLAGAGSVVASARSAFLDYRNFYDNASRYSGDSSVAYTVEVIGVEPWNDQQVEQYFRAFGDELHGRGDELVQALHQRLRDLSEANRELLRKPFYASRLATLLAEGEQFTTEVDLLDQFVDAFLAREHKKLLDKEGKPLLSVKGHRAFVTGIAEEMWWQENRSLDVGTVQTVAELVVEQFGLPPGAANAIVERVSSYAFLTTARSERRLLRFEHEVFYGYFLAKKLQDVIERDPEDLRRFLARAVFEDTLVSQVAKLLGPDVGRCTRAVEAICAVLRPSVTEVIARENAGLLIATILRSARQLQNDVVIRNVIFRDVDFGDVGLTRPRFEHCDFEGADLQQVQFENPVFTNTVLRTVKVDPARTRLTGAVLSVDEGVQGLFVRDVGRVYEPAEIRKHLRRLGVQLVDDPGASTPAYSRAVQSRIHTLDRFLRKMERRYQISEEDLRVVGISTERAWTDVRDLLEHHGLLVEHFIDKSGPRVPLLRLTVPAQQLRSAENTNDRTVSPQVHAFWLDLLRG